MEIALDDHAAGRVDAQPQRAVAVQDPRVHSRRRLRHAQAHVERDRGRARMRGRRAGGRESGNRNDEQRTGRW